MKRVLTVRMMMTRDAGKCLVMVKVKTRVRMRMRMISRLRVNMRVSAWSMSTKEILDVTMSEEKTAWRAKEIKERERDKIGKEEVREKDIVADISPASFDGLTKPSDRCLLRTKSVH